MPRQVSQEDAQRWLELAEVGMTYSQIARREKRDPRTVEVNVEKLRRARDVRTWREEAVRQAYREHTSVLLREVDALLANLRESPLATDAPLPLFAPDRTEFTVMGCLIDIAGAEPEAEYLHADSLEWELLMEHLDGDPFVDLLGDWKARLGELTRKHVDLVSAVRARLAEVGVPVEDLGDDTPHIRLRGAQDVVDACLAAAKDNPDALKRFVKQLKIDDGGNGIWFGSTEVLHAPGTAGTHSKNLRSSIAALERDPAMTDFTKAYDRTIAACRTLEKEARILKAANFLPGQCKGCSRFRP